MAFMLGKQLVRVPSQTPQMDTLVWWDGNGGLVTDIHEKLLGLSDFAVLTNVRYENGKLRTREGLYKATATALTGGKYYKTIEVIPIGTGFKLLGVADDYKLYSLTGTEGTTLAPGASIATLSGDTRILPFAGAAILCDTGYLKFYNGTAVNIMYDDGTGTAGYLFNHLTDDNDGSTPLYTGSIMAVGDQETTSAFGVGFTITTTKIRVWLSKTGTITGTIAGKLYSDAGALISTSTNTIDVSTLSTNAAVYDFTFTAGNMSPSTAYRYGLLYIAAAPNTSDASNHPNVHYDTVASGGYAYTWTVAGGWVAVTTRNYLIGIKPGLPPKASFGCVADNRLHVVNPTYPGRVAISAPGDGFDWCTPTLAGYVNAVDDDANSFPIGAMVAKYNDVWFWGKVKQPYLAKLTGASPADWVVSLVGQEAYTDHKSIQDTIDDLYFASKMNCHSMAGVQEYGDIRVGGPGNPIKNLFEEKWTTAAFSGYWGQTGQFFIYLPTYGTMVCNTKDPQKRWTRYTYKGLTETAYGCGESLRFYVACSDGHLYRFYETVFTDSGTAYDITIESGVVEMPFGEMELVKLYQVMPTGGTTTGVLHIYPDGSSTAKRSLVIANGTLPQGDNCRMNAKSLKVKVNTVAFTATTYFGPLIMRARKLYGLGQR